MLAGSRSCITLRGRCQRLRTDDAVPVQSQVSCSANGDLHYCKGFAGRSAACWTTRRTLYFKTENLMHRGISRAGLPDVPEPVPVNVGAMSSSSLCKVPEARLPREARPRASPGTARGGGAVTPSHTGF